MLVLRESTVDFGNEPMDPQGYWKKKNNFIPRSFLETFPKKSNPFPLLIKVSLIINICFGSPKSGNTTFRTANTKPILK